MENVDVETVRRVFVTLGVGFTSIVSLVASILWIKDQSSKTHWWKLLSFLRQRTEDIENKVFSFDEALEPKFITDRKGDILLINKSTSDLFGFDKEEIKSKNISIIVQDANREIFFSMYESAKTDRRFKIDAVCRKGTCPVEVVFRKKTEDLFLIIIRDRSDEVRIARSLQQIIDLVKMNIDVLAKGEEIGNNGSWVWNIETGKLRTSAGYRRIIGEDDKVVEFEAQYLRDRVWKGDNDLVAEALAKAYSGEAYDITYHLKRQDLSIAKINSIAYPVMSENGKRLLYVYGSTHLIEVIPLEEFVKII